MTLNPKIISLCGFSGTLSQACRHFNIPINVYSARKYKLGWTTEKALTTPIRKKKTTHPSLKNIEFYFEDEKELKLLSLISKELQAFIRNKRIDYKYFSKTALAILKQFLMSEAREFTFHTKYVNFTVIKNGLLQY